MAHRAANSISELVYMALQVTFKTSTGTFDVCLYLKCKQQHEELASEKITHWNYYIFFLFTEIIHSCCNNLGVELCNLES